MKDSNLTLMLVTQLGDGSLDCYLDFIRNCIGSGVTAIQLREKKLVGIDLLRYAKSLHALTKSYNLPLVVNDSLELCLTINAEGLHLGQKDGDVYVARQALGPNKILGLSVNSVKDIVAANSMPVDYIGVGPIFFSANKPDKETWGLSGLRHAVSLSKHPVVAIGGINSVNKKVVLNTGVRGIAAIEAFNTGVF